VATVIFYEKPGCGTNARQKLALAKAGHDLDVRNLLTAPFTAQQLRAFFGDLPIPSWFNPTAPAVKAGAVDPEAVDSNAALEMMLANPILIRRPLLETNGKRCAGFDLARLGLALDGDLPDTCIRPGHSHE
jgi:nitrogenase-associated protein